MVKKAFGWFEGLILLIGLFAMFSDKIGLPTSSNSKIYGLLLIMFGYANYRINKLDNKK